MSTVYLFRMTFDKAGFFCTVCHQSVGVRLKTLFCIFGTKIDHYIYANSRWRFWSLMPNGQRQLWSIMLVLSGHYMSCMLRWIPESKMDYRSYNDWSVVYEHSSKICHFRASSTAVVSWTLVTVAVLFVASNHKQSAPFNSFLLLVDICILNCMLY